MEETKQRLLRETDAARYLSLSRIFLRKSRSEGVRRGRVPGPPFVRVGKRGIRYDIRALDAWIEANTESVPGAEEGLE